MAEWNIADTLKKGKDELEVEHARLQKKEGEHLPCIINCFRDVFHELVSESIRAHDNRADQAIEHIVVIRWILEETINRLIEDILHVEKSLRIFLKNYVNLKKERS